MSDRVYVVLLNWNGWQDTITCLESLLRLDYPNFRVVLCDNASSNDSMGKLRDWMSGKLSADLAGTPLHQLLQQSQQQPARRPAGWAEYDRIAAEAGGEAAVDAPCVLIQTGANLGFAGGCNVGVRYALARRDADHVWLLNNDTVVASDALSHLVQAAQSNVRAGIVGSTLRFFANPGHVQALAGGTFNPWRAMTRHIAEGSAVRELAAAEVAAVEDRMAYVVGASMLVSRALLDEVGLMQEDYFLYFEEIDWAERARRATPPFKLVFAERSMVFHRVGASAGTAVRSALSQRYLTINRLRFMKRFYPRYLPWARGWLLWEGLKAALKGRSGDARLLARVALSSVRA